MYGTVCKKHKIYEVSRGPLSDVIEAAATIIHNLRFTKPIACDPNGRIRSMARFVFMVFRFESGQRRQF